MKEIWVDIKDYRGIYQISNMGRVKSFHKNRERILKNAIGTTGYYYVQLYKNCAFKNEKVHRLVARAFTPNPSNLPCVNHIDSNKLNNCIKNLEWCTHGENITHAIKNGRRTYKSGDNHYLTKYSDDFIIDCVKKYSEGFCVKNILKCFEISPSTLYNIMGGRSRKHLHEDIQKILKGSRL